MSSVHNNHYDYSYLAAVSQVRVLQHDICACARFNHAFPKVLFRLVSYPALLHILPTIRFPSIGYAGHVPADGLGHDVLCA